MADEPTKDPTFTTDAEIAAENERRKKAIELLKKSSAEQIRQAMTCTLDGGVGRPMTLKAGELLYVNATWLVRPQDRKEYGQLMYEMTSGVNNPFSVFSEGPFEKAKRVAAKLDAIYRRGSDHLRAAVGSAAAWACVPAELLAAVLQNENSPKASTFQRTGQGAERWAQELVGYGSTGFGNVKPETLAYIKVIFKEFYLRSILGPGVKDEDQNDNAETDIYHAAAVLRDGLNKAWSAGERSLNGEQLKKYHYYPYFGGVVSQSVAIRAMGHYNGMGDGAKTYGETGLKRIQKETLFFLPPK